jgi:hypothetical protein
VPSTATRIGSVHVALVPFASLAVASKDGIPFGERVNHAVLIDRGKRRRLGRPRDRRRHRVAICIEQRGEQLIFEPTGSGTSVKPPGERDPIRRLRRADVARAEGRWRGVPAIWKSCCNEFPTGRCFLRRRYRLTSVQPPVRWRP